MNIGNADLAEKRGVAW